MDWGKSPARFARRVRKVRKCKVLQGFRGKWIGKNLARFARRVRDFEKCKVSDGFLGKWTRNPSKLSSQPGWPWGPAEGAFLETLEDFLAKWLN